MSAIHTKPISRNELFLLNVHSRRSTVYRLLFVAELSFIKLQVLAVEEEINKVSTSNSMRIALPVRVSIGLNL